MGVISGAAQQQRRNVGTVNHADRFIFTVDTTRAGSASGSFQIPSSNTGAYDYSWTEVGGAGSGSGTGTGADMTVVTGISGQVQFSIHPTSGALFNDFAFANGGDKLKLDTVDQWGSTVWSTMDSAFFGCNNLTTTASDIPDFSGLTSLSRMFQNATNATPTTTDWDMSTVEDLSNAFRGADSANPNGASWDTGNVTSYSNTFRGAVAYTRYSDAQYWNISAASNMGNMYFGHTIPTADYESILIAWDAQSVQTGVVFDGGSSQYSSYAAATARSNLISDHGWVITDGGRAAEFIFTVDATIAGASAVGSFIIPSANTSYTVDWEEVGNEVANNGSVAVTTADETIVMGGSGIYKLSIDPAVGTFNDFAFDDAGDKLKLDTIDQWGTTTWATLEGMFHGCSNLTTTASDIPDFSIVTSMRSMFHQASLATPTTTNWDTSGVTSMLYTFWQATVANPDVSNWDVALVTTMFRMFRNAEAAEPDVSNWVTSSLTNTNSMFQSADAASPDASGFDVTLLTNATNMFIGITIPTADYDALLIAWDAQSVQTGVAFHGGDSQYSSYAAATARSNLISDHGWVITDGGRAAEFIFTVDATIAGASAVGSFIIPSANTSYTVDWEEVGNEVANNGSVAVTTADETIVMGGSGIYKLSIDPAVGTFNDFAFDNAGDKLKLNTIDQWGTTTWATASGMFNGCSYLTTTAHDVPDFSSVTTTNSMFQSAVLATPTTTNWNLSSVTQMQSMFLGATAANPNTTNWDTSAVISMSQMFWLASSANPDVSNWDVALVTTTFRMFREATVAEPDTSSWTTSSLSNSISMFQSAIAANPDVSGFDVSGLTNATNMFVGSALNSTNYNALLIAWDAQSVQTGVAFHGGDSQASGAGAIARANLISDHGWVITDGGIVPEFIFTVDATIAGDSAIGSFKMPSSNTSYIVDWEEVGNEIANNGSIGITGANETIVMGGSGTYRLTIDSTVGTFNDFGFAFAGDKLKLKTLDQWGATAWASAGLSGGFHGATNLTTVATGAPDLSLSTSLINTWANCSGLAAMALIDTSSCLYFSQTWLGCNTMTAFPLIDTSAVADMPGAWSGCSGLTAFPLIDTSQTQRFDKTWTDCTGLTAFPALDFSSGNNFYQAWDGCTSLVTFPANSFDSVTVCDFRESFINTALDQASIDGILASLVASGVTTGTRQLDQSGGSAPSSAGEASIDTLRARGFTISVAGAY